MNVLARARIETCRRLSLARKPIKYKGLQRHRLSWPGTCLSVGPLVLPHRLKDLWLIFNAPRILHLV